MAHPKRPNAAITDTRKLLLEDRERFVVEFDRCEAADKKLWAGLIAELDTKLAALQVEASKVSDRRAKMRAKARAGKPMGKAGRPRKLRDSAGVPLYQGVPELDDDSSKKSFLEKLKTNDVASTQ